MSCRTLVTGAAGFIGSHLVEALTEDGISVRALVQPGVDQSNLSGACVETFEGDIRDPEALRKAMDNVDVVYHLAAISRHDANVPDSEYHAVNVKGTENVLKAASKAGAKRLLFTGTIEAVGMSRDKKPLTEQSPQHPRNIYGETKLQAEQLVRGSNGKGGLETVVVRPPMTYGPREMLLLARMFKVVDKGVFPLIGSGQALTEFCYVKNQVHGIRLAAERGQPGEVYFISDAQPYSIQQVVDTIAGAIGKRLWKPHLPIPLALTIGFGLEQLSRVLRFYPFRIPQTGRPPFSRKSVAWLADSRLYVDIAKAKRELGYTPEFTLAQGINETVTWYRQNGHLKTARMD